MFLKKEQKKKVPSGQDGTLNNAKWAISTLLKKIISVAIFCDI